ncbi:MAG TPA: ribonuclease HII, partial [Flexilinea sp.]|nr:ribonuclease HII [Flexilinea sp.]
MKKNPTLDYEKALWEQGFFYVAGIDEAGRGAWAGPVMAGAVIFPVDENLPVILDGVRDSKQMTPETREEKFRIITDYAIGWAVGSASNWEIDSMGILPATRLAMDRAIAQLQPLPQYLLIDYVRLFRQMMPQKSIIKGDECSYSIAAASILAKVCRDHWMVEHCAEEFPQYGFEHHKGYGTQFH